MALVSSSYQSCHTGLGISQVHGVRLHEVRQVEVDGEVRKRLLHLLHEVTCYDVSRGLLTLLPEGPHGVDDLLGDVLHGVEFFLIPTSQTLFRGMHSSRPPRLFARTTIMSTTFSCAWQHNGRSCPEGWVKPTLVE